MPFVGSIGWGFHRMSFNLGFSDAFFVIRLGLWGRKTTEEKYHSPDLISRQYAISRTHHCRY